MCAQAQPSKMNRRLFNLEKYQKIRDYKMSAVQDSDVPIWMSQLAALTHKNRGSSTRISPPAKEKNEGSPTVSNSGKKRPGTGRRLPSIPTACSSSSTTSSPLSESYASDPVQSKHVSSKAPTSFSKRTSHPPASKPVMSSTRPNRAFELRRSNADSSIRRKSTSSMSSTPPLQNGASAPKPVIKFTPYKPKSTLKSKTSNSQISNLKKELKKTNIADPPKKMSSKSQSTPASRNNSPKTLAFKRRMEYDPRKAVSEAKAKSKKATTVQSAVQPKTNLVRSSSCSNSEELCGLGSMKELSRSCMYKSAFSTPSPKDLTNTSPLQRSASLRLQRSTLDSLQNPVTDTQCQQNGLHRTESYNPLLVSSIYQLSLQIKSQFEKTVEKLKDQGKIPATPSPIDDFLEEPEKSRFPAWKSANNELISILKNLRRIKHQMHAVDSVLFPSTDQTLDQIHRLSREITEFHPINNPEYSDEGSQSPDMMDEMFY